jgi:hypothetical protein
MRGFRVLRRLASLPFLLHAPRLCRTRSLLPRGEDPARTTYALASLLMTGVLDNLGSIWRLLGDPMLVLGQIVIARSALETGATAWWLMEPGIGGERPQAHR